MPSGPSGPGLDELFTAKQAAELFETTINVILMWRNRGYVDENGERHTLAVHSYDDRGRPLYRVGDLFKTESGIRQSRRRTGLPPRPKLAHPYVRRTA